MNKNEVVAAIVEKVETLKAKDVETVLAAYADVVIEKLENNNAEKVVLPGLGSFKVKDVPERKGVSALGNKKEWSKPAHKEICFKITKSVKELG